MPDLDPRVGEVAEKQAIMETLVRYTLTLDANDMDGLESCFADAAELATSIDHVFGRAAIRERYERLRGAQAANGEVPRHVLSNVQITLAGDRAEVVSYYTLVVAVSGQARLGWIGRYLDVLVREADAWRFQRREICVDGQG